MKKSRRKFSASFKAKVAIEAIKEQQTLHELTSKYEVQATQINTWKREFLENAEAAFTKGRALDNVYIERFWGSLKREKIYLNPPNGGMDLHQKVNDYVTFYNTVRRHDSLDGETPDSVCYAKKAHKKASEI